MPRRIDGTDAGAAYRVAARVLDDALGATGLRGGRCGQTEDDECGCGELETSRHGHPPRRLYLTPVHGAGDGPGQRARVESGTVVSGGRLEHPGLKGPPGAKA